MNHLITPILEDDTHLETCENCEGRGEIFEAHFCRKSYYNCCGGCGDWEECPECEGTGKIKNDEDE